MNLETQEALNLLAQDIVRSLEDRVDLAQILDPTDSLNDETFGYINSVISAMLQRATIPPEFVPKTWLCPAGCGERVYFGSTCSECAEVAGVSSNVQGIGISEIMNE
jgi:hypothetical protein